MAHDPVADDADAAVLEFERAAGVYELVEPVLQIDSNGDVARV